LSGYAQIVKALRSGSPERLVTSVAGGGGHEVIRVARVDELDGLREIERSAGRWFAGLGMAAIAEDEPPSVETLAEYQRDGRAWVYGDPPVAYLIADWVDGSLHIEQVSVHADHAGQRIGRRLIEHVAAWAGNPLTLTTFAEVPWNAPYYERLGFRRLGDAELTAGLRRIRAAEAAHGLDRWPRVAMRRESLA
jgi:GNAT superfamily N-acetyltransferase